MFGHIFKMLFNDKLRVFATGALLLAILVSAVGGWLYPKQPPITSETLKTLQGVSDQIKLTAELLNKQSVETSKLNSQLKIQLEEMERVRNENYKELLDKYGIGETPIDPSTIDYRRFIDDPSAIDGLFKENNYPGSQHLLRVPIPQD